MSVVGDGELAVQRHRRDPFLALGHEVDALEPHREGELRGLEDGAGGNRGLAVAAIALLELVCGQLAASVVAAVRAHGRRACARRWLRAMVSCMAFQSLRELHDAGRLMHHWNALIHQDALARGLLDLFWSSDF